MGSMNDYEGSRPRRVTSTILRCASLRIIQDVEPAL